MIGLGRMGANMTRRLLADGHDCVVFDAAPAQVAELAGEGATAADSLSALVEKLAPPRVIWIMLPAAFVDDTVRDLLSMLEPDDTLIDGGNSHYVDDIRRAGDAKEKGVHYVDVGTSGGVWGLERGYCLMIGGETQPVARCSPVFASLAPGVDAAERTPGREGGTAEQGYLHCGPSGAGHFVKMVHNGIEYGIMAAYAEGLGVLEAANIGSETARHDAETTPLKNPEHYRYELDLKDITEVWRRGSVIRSWLLDLTAAALLEDSQLEAFAGSVSDSGEGRWTVQAAVDEGVPVHVIASALFERFGSRGRGDFADKVLSAMRYQFGGHHEKHDDRP